MVSSAQQDAHATPNKGAMQNSPNESDKMLHPISHKRRRQKLSSKPRILSTIDLAIAVAPVTAHVSLHVGDVVKFGNIAVFLHVWAFVLGHGGDEVFDDFVGDE